MVGMACQGALFKALRALFVDKSYINALFMLYLIDFIGLEFADIAEVQKTLKKYNLLVNADKTEQTTLSRSGKEYKN